MDLDFSLQVITVISAILLIISILLQQRGASLGAGFGSSGELYTSRRGLDKSLFNTSIILTIIFIGSILGSLLIAR